MLSITKSVIILIVTASLILYFKPKYFFDSSTGEPKEFGVDDNEILVPYYLVAFGVAVASYLILLLIGNVNKIDT
jgi:hypothetical protein